MSTEATERPTTMPVAEQNADLVCVGTLVPAGTVIKDLPPGRYVTDTSLVLDSEGRLTEGRLVRAE